MLYCVLQRASLVSSLAANKVERSHEIKACAMHFPLHKVIRLLFMTVATTISTLGCLSLEKHFSFILLFIYMGCSVFSYWICGNIKNKPELIRMEEIHKMAQMYMDTQKNFLPNKSLTLMMQQWQILAAIF